MTPANPRSTLGASCSKVWTHDTHHTYNDSLVVGSVGRHPDPPFITEALLPQAWGAMAADDSQLSPPGIALKRPALSRRSPHPRTGLWLGGGYRRVHWEHVWRNIPTSELPNRLGEVCYDCIAISLLPLFCLSCFPHCLRGLFPRVRPSKTPTHESPHQSVFREPDLRHPV